MPSESEVTLARLLISASTQHTRLTIEPLPVGMIEVNRTGVIKSIDEWIESRLQFSARSLIGTNISVLFEDDCFEFQRLMQGHELGYVGKVRLRTATGNTFDAEIVIQESLQPHSCVFTVILGEQCTKQTTIGP